MFLPDFDINSKYVKLLENGKIIVVKKTTLCWLLQAKTEKISTDRLRRFMSFAKPPTNTVSDCSVRSEIYFGDWCGFYQQDAIFIGQIVGFTYIKCKGRTKNFNGTFCPIKPPSNVENPSGINVLANWFEYSMEKSKLNFVGKAIFININTYITHIDAPIFTIDLILTEPSKNHLQSLNGEKDDPFII
jgi:hypothetical protein